MGIRADKDCVSLCLLVVCSAAAAAVAAAAENLEQVDGGAKAACGKASVGDLCGFQGCCCFSSSLGLIVW